MPKQQSILWVQVWGLALVQGAIALTWVIYNLYLGTLLTEFGFPPSLATTLLVVENALAIVMEPLMGSFSDQLQHQMGSRFPLIALGMVLAGGAFLAIPLIALGGAGGLRWLLPGMMVVWALTMTLFRSPALSLLGRYAFATQLPQAASILTLVGGLAGAIAPLAGTFILSLGPLVTFGIGSFVLVLAAVVLGRIHPDQQVGDPTPGPRPQPISWGALGLVFGTGMGITLGFRLLMQVLPATLSSRLSPNTTALVMGSLFLALAVTAIPAGTLATRLGNGKSMMVGLGGMTMLCGVIGLSPSGGVAVLVAIALGSAFSLVSNGTIPFALALAPADKSGLGTGMYFGGGALASSLFGFLSKPLGAIGAQGSWLSALAFVAAACCIAVSMRLKAPQTRQG